MKNYLKIIFLFLFALVQLFAFGLLKNNFGWLICFIGYSLLYFFIGVVLPSLKLKGNLQYLIVLSASLFIPISLYIDGRDFYFPGIIPEIFIWSSLALIGGYYFRRTKFVSLAILVMIISTNFYWYKYYLPTYFFQKTLNKSYYSKLNGKKVELEFQDLYGKPIDKSLYKDKVVVLDFWFTGCAGCIQKFKYLDQVRDQFEGQPNVLVASVLVGNTIDREKVNSILKRNPLKSPVLLDSAGVFVSKYHIGVNGYPVEIHLDRQGRVNETVAGFAWGSGSENVYVNQTIKRISSLLKE